MRAQDSQTARARRSRAALPRAARVLVMERTSFATSGMPCEFMRIPIAPERYACRLSLPGPVEIARAFHPVPASRASATPVVPRHVPGRIAR